MKLPGVPYTPHYMTDESVMGVIVAIALHVAIIGPFVYKATHPSAHSDEDDKPLVSRPVVQASLLKLGKPIDPKKLPDRLVPQQRTAPKKQVTASQEDPGKKQPDAGAPPPVTEDADLTNLVNKSDPFAEKNSKKSDSEKALDHDRLLPQISTHTASGVAGGRFGPRGQAALWR